MLADISRARAQGPRRTSNQLYALQSADYLRQWFGRHKYSQSAHARQGSAIGAGSRAQSRKPGTGDTSYGRRSQPVLGHHPAPVFPRDKRGARLRGDHAQSKRRYHDPIQPDRIMTYGVYAWIERVDRCPLHPNAGQIRQRSEMTRCAVNSPSTCPSPDPVWVRP